MEVELGTIKEYGLAEASLLPALVAQGLGVSPAEKLTQRGERSFRSQSHGGASMHDLEGEPKRV